MPHRRFDWHERIKAVEREYWSARIAVDRLAREVAGDASLLGRLIPGQAAEAFLMADVEVEVLPPLADCFQHCEVECVRECCGIDAISTDAKLIASWSHQAGPAAVGRALDQLRQIIATVEDRSHKVCSQFLNHYTNDETAREALLAFLGAFRSALDAE